MTTPHIVPLIPRWCVCCDHKVFVPADADDATGPLVCAGCELAGLDARGTATNEGSAYGPEDERIR